eukprot:scaffold60826_cov63-Phaeocystis_antarctica.AAC.1
MATTSLCSGGEFGTVGEPLANPPPPLPPPPPPPRPAAAAPDGGINSRSASPRALGRGLAVAALKEALVAALVALATRAWPPLPAATLAAAAGLARPLTRSDARAAPCCGGGGGGGGGGG